MLVYINHNIIDQAKYSTSDLSQTVINKLIVLMKIYPSITSDKTIRNALMTVFVPKRIKRNDNNHDNL